MGVEGSRFVYEKEKHSEEELPSMIKLIITDLDNTLLNDVKVISSYSSEILRECQRKGIKFVFATARPERATKIIQKSFQPDYIISNNGATISHGDNVIFNNVIDTEIGNSVLADLSEIGEVTCLTVEAGKCLYTDYSGKPWDNENWNPVHFDFSKSFDEDIVKISTECKKTELLDNLILKYPSLHLYHNNGEDWSQIMHINSTKMNAINYLAKILNTHISNIAAFGDDFNDIDMIKNCGIGIAVGNAVDSVKQVADFICLTNNDDGVAEWIKANIL